MTEYGFLKTAVGWIKVECSCRGITGVNFVKKGKTSEKQSVQVRRALQQLKDYFEGKRRKFVLPLVIEGTPFQRKVYNELLKIPFGETRSYGDIAKRLKNPGAARAVGSANNKNSIAIIIPCHRVIGANKTLVGYAAGLKKKSWLLNHELASARFDH